MAGLDGCGNLTPDLPAGSKSLNRLSYPGLYKVTISVYCDEHTNPIHCVRNYVVTGGGTYSYHWVLRNYRTRRNIRE